MAYERLSSYIADKQRCKYIKVRLMDSDILIILRKIIDNHLSQSGFDSE